MPRAIFPYPWDREVLDCFLAGVPQFSHTESDLKVADNKLLWADTVIAWYDTGGALVVIPPLQVGPVLNYVVHATHHMLDTLGIHDQRLTFERDENPPTHVASPIWFYGNARVNLTVPLVLCGPLTIQAYRASKGAPIISPSTNK